MKGKKVKYSKILIGWFGSLLILLTVIIILFVSVGSYRMLLNQMITGKINEITLINQKIGSVLSYSNAVNDFLYYDEGAYGYFGLGEISAEDNDEVSYRLRMDKARIKALLNNFAKGFDVVLIGDNGIEATSYMNYEAIDFDVLRKSEVLKKSIDEETEKGEFIISGIYKKDRGRSYYIKYHNVFSVLDGEYIGTQLVLIQDSYFKNSYSKLKYDIGKIFLYDENNTLFNARNYSEKEAELVREFALKNDDEYIILDGHLLIKDTSAETGWTVAESIPLSNITDKISDLMRNIVIFSVIALVVGSLMIILLSKRLTKPLRDFNSIIEKTSIGQEQYKEYFGDSRIAEIDSLYSSFSDMNKRNTELVNKLIDNENEKRLAELNYLRAQINPHFIYNTLFSIKCTIDMDRKSEAIKMIDLLNEMLRRMLRFKEETTTLREELMYIYSYVKMLQFSYEKKLSLKIEMSDDMQAMKIPRFILQPIVENAVFHGVQPQNEDGEIIISGMHEEDKIEIMIHDNGVGFSKERLKEVMSEEYINKKGAEHIGVINVHNRIRSYYGEKYGIKIESEPDEGTTVYIIIPAEMREEKTYEENTDCG